MYEHGFTKNTIVINLACLTFYAPSRKFKILAIPNVLLYGKLYEHGFVKKHDGRKLCAKSRFDQFFMHCLENLKYWPFSKVQNT
ncbi:hypothetical protein BHE74_00043393 [Ensete ventricosum]|nr:hypothetical protein GW17_00042648 [Ensete ventricosum]RWW50363.1 hypothetical protein BHE74_00043393 [Ensete ventricosum]